MDSPVEERVKTFDDDLQKNMADIDECSKEMGSMMRAHLEKIREWGSTMIEMDSKYSSMFGAYLNVLFSK